MKIKAEEKNNWSIDLHLHIPLPSISIEVHGGDSQKIPNEPLHYEEAVVEDEVEIES